ncbi:hypothetical protein AYI68_g7334, partial [Smittium mucronatum]
MVSRPYGSVNFSATNSAGNHDHTKSKKWKVSILGKKAPTLDSLKNQQRFLKSQGLENYDFVCILPKKRHFRFLSRYSSVQQR